MIHLTDNYKIFKKKIRLKVFSLRIFVIDTDANNNKYNYTTQYFTENESCTLLYDFY